MIIIIITTKSPPTHLQHPHPPRLSSGCFPMLQPWPWLLSSGPTRRWNSCTDASGRSGCRQRPGPSPATKSWKPGAAKNGRPCYFLWPKNWVSSWFKQQKWGLNAWVRCFTSTGSPHFLIPTVLTHIPPSPSSSPARLKGAPPGICDTDAGVPKSWAAAASCSSCRRSSRMSHVLSGNGWIQSPHNKRLNDNV